MVKIAAVGDNVVDCYVSRGLMYPGGNCLNVSVFASRFGASSAYIGAIGADPAGRLIATALNEEGIDTSRLRVVAGPTDLIVSSRRLPPPRRSPTIFRFGAMRPTAKRSGHSVFSPQSPAAIFRPTRRNRSPIISWHLVHSGCW
jgi:hypothetical protein